MCKALRSEPTQWWCFDLDLAFNELSHPLCNVSWIVAWPLDFKFGQCFLGDDKTDLVIWCVFSSFSYVVQSWSCVDFLCCLAGIFVGIFRRFHWEFTKRCMCIVWIEFLHVFWVSIGFKRYIFVHFLQRFWYFFFMNSKILVLLLC